ncbi:MAG: hypothetical protein C0607_13760 [Azoarcus sp.]|nr:MAG: hypothetical protein C0607_13760 [Azoarcus sp.]
MVVTTPKPHQEILFMKLKKSVAALVLGLSLAGSASAAVYDLGTITPGTVLSDFSSTFASGTSFTDTWNFSIATPLESAGWISNVILGTWYNITGLSASLFTSSGIELYDLNANPASTADTLYGSGTFAAGDYYFEVSGTATGPNGGLYAFSVTTQPVPEPGTYAMMLAGLGLIGAVARRRMSDNA